MLTTSRCHPKHLALSLAAALLAGCGPAVDLDSTDAGKQVGSGGQALTATNGLSANGLNMNGLNMNGLNMNGLNMNGLSTSAFSSWFNGDTSISATVMKYLYGCAAPAGSKLVWTNPVTRTKYTWVGVFGLASDWTSGKAASLAEQQLVTACLAAHVNKFGQLVPIAVEGRTAKGVQIPIGATELATYSVREGCFFGNLFTGTGAFVTPDHTIYPRSYSTARACGFETTVNSAFDTDCSPLQAIADECRRLCVPDATGTFYETCTWNGVTYRAITTRLRPADIYQCGDGVCQFTESCGDAKTFDSCLADCGACP